MNARMINETAKQTVVMETGRIDSRGRRIGVAITTYECDFVQDDEAKVFYYVDREGHYYRVNMQPTRDGIRFGRCYPDYTFRTETKRSEYITKCLESSKKKELK